MKGLKIVEVIRQLLLREKLFIVELIFRDIWENTFWNKKEEEQR